MIRLDRLFHKAFGSTRPQGREPACAEGTSMVIIAIGHAANRLALKCMLGPGDTGMAGQISQWTGQDVRRGDRDAFSGTPSGCCFRGVLCLIRCRSGKNVALRPDAWHPEAPPRTRGAARSRN